jgi:hypothetical protein
MSNFYNNYLSNYPRVKFEELAKPFYKWFQKVQNDEQGYM